MLQPLPGHWLCSNSDLRQMFTPIYQPLPPNNRTTSSPKMHRYGIPEPIWQQVGRKTLTTTAKLGTILLRRASNDFGAKHYGIQTIKMGFNHFWTFVTFWYRGMHHCGFVQYLNHWSVTEMKLELRNACIISLGFIVLKVWDGTESKYSSIVFWVYYMTSILSRKYLTCEIWLLPELQFITA